MKTNIYRGCVAFLLLFLIFAFGSCNENTLPKIEEKCVHIFGEWEETESATCTEQGLETRTCQKCGEIETRYYPAFGHTPTKDNAVKATCITTGLTEGKHCVICGETIVAQETIPATGKHNYVGKVTTDATCTEDGVKTFTCSVCNDSYTETIPATGKHNYVGKVTTDAT